MGFLMAKQRFRDVKQGKTTPVKQKTEKSTPTRHGREYATVGEKLKAFLTDSFMLLMPIMYLVFYLVMDGREGFAAHKALGWFYILVPLVIVQTIFMTRTGQTPGYKAYNIEVIDEATGERPSAFIILFRNFAAILSMATLFGWMLMFVRKDRKNLHDLLSNTAVVKKT
jgi:uncharacterized RDD family membrane protein YckC